MSVVVDPDATLAVDGSTVTLPTGTSVTVMVAVPDLPSLVAVIVAVPGSTPVTTPPCDTVATSALLVLQVTCRPVSVFPDTSFVVAVSVVVPRTNIVALDGETVTVETGTDVTVTVAVPVFPSLVAVIVTVPGATPVTTPLVDTVAIDEALVDHVTVRPVSVLPFTSLVVALNVDVPPTTTVAVDGVTVTVATGAGVTVTVAVPVLPSLVAVIVAVPGEAPVTTPLVETVAIPDALVVHVTVRPVSVFPLPSFTVADSVEVAPTATDTVLGDTVTVATGIGVTVIVAVADLPSLVAVIVAVPDATPATTPLVDTVAIAEALVDHVTVRPVSTVPLPSFVVATRVVVWPTATEAVVG